MYPWIIKQILIVFQTSSMNAVVLLHKYLNYPGSIISCTAVCKIKILTISLLNISTNFLSMRYISYQSNISLSNFPHRSFYWLMHLPETRCFSDSITLMTGLLWTVKVWNNWGPLPTVSGCWTMTLTVPELVPYAISIQLPLMPAYKRKQINF